MWPSGYNIWLTSMKPQDCISARSSLVGWPVRKINVQQCGGLSVVLLQLKDLLEVFVKKREFITSSKFLSYPDVT